MTRFLSSMGQIGTGMLGLALALAGVAVFVSGEGRATLLVVALSMVITGFVFRTFGARMGEVSSAAALRAGGVPGTATIAGIGDTGITVNNDPMVAFALDVQGPAGDPYRVEIRQLLSRLMIGALTPGATVAVLIDPADPQRVAIDWERTADPGTAPTPRFRVSSAADLIRTGRRGTATITSMKDLGDISDLGVVPTGSPGDDDRVFVVDLSVKLPGRSPYDASTGHRVPQRLVGTIGPGAVVVVAVDRDDDGDVAIDWDADPAADPGPH